VYLPRSDDRWGAALTLSRASGLVGTALAVCLPNAHSRVW
jgi:hypothetical protein